MHEKTVGTVEILHGDTRVASYVRSYVHGGRTTTPEHMPTHRAHAECTPTRIASGAEKVGSNTRALCETILRDRNHPEWGFRSCLGLFRLVKKYGAARVEAACARALRRRAQLNPFSMKARSRCLVLCAFTAACVEADGPPRSGRASDLASPVPLARAALDASGRLASIDAGATSRPPEGETRADLEAPDSAGRAGSESLEEIARGCRFVQR